MTLTGKLKIILRLSGLTQAELAAKLDVTFAALNRWMNEKASPHPKMAAKIDELYLECTGQKHIPPNMLSAKKELLASYRRHHPRVLQFILNNPDVKQQFELSLTYNSNRIEGSSLSERDTEDILFHNRALPDKSLTEQLEAKNHQTTLRYLFDFLLTRKPITEELIMKLHSILMSGIRDDAGLYRRHAVRIVGSFVPTANFLKISTLMENLLKTIHAKKTDTVAHAASIHAQFEQIHPFSDGNGRIGRLLTYAMLFKKNFAPAVIQQKNRRTYFACLQKAQLHNDFSMLEDFLCDAVETGYKMVERKSVE